MSPTAQLRLKSGIVLDALRRIAKLPEPPEPEVVALAEPALRTTARLAVSPGGRAGHRPHGGTGAVETGACLVAHPLLEELIVHGRYPGAREVLLRVAAATGERLVRVDRGAADVRVPHDVQVIRTGDTGPAFVHELVTGRRFQISADSFVQPGPVAAAALATAVSTAIGDALPTGGALMDAYAGVGLFASVVGAERQARVVAVESDPRPSRTPG